MLSFVYPGQGSQQSGMGQFLFDEFKICKETLEEASDTLNQDMAELCFSDHHQDLHMTENTQPALLTISTCYSRVFREILGLEPKVLSGHSIGEYPALVTSGVLSLPDALRAVKKRGQSMQAAVPAGQGMMIACLGLDRQQVEEMCQWAVENSGTGPLSPANFNSPDQIVISGSAVAGKYLVEHFSTDIFSKPPRRPKLIALNVSAPFHCEMMKPAEEQMSEFINGLEFQAPKIPVIQNYKAESQSDTTSIREHLIRQISAPVLWVDCVEKMKELGVNQVIECGHGKVLAGLIKKIDRDNLETFNVNSLDELKALEKAFH